MFDKRIYKKIYKVSLFNNASRKSIDDFSSHYFNLEKTVRISDKVYTRFYRCSKCMVSISVQDPEPYEHEHDICEDNRLMEAGSWLDSCELETMDGALR